MAKQRLGEGENERLPLASLSPSSNMGTMDAILSTEQALLLKMPTHSFMSHTMGPTQQPCPIQWHLLLQVIVMEPKELCSCVSTEACVLAFLSLKKN